MKSLSYRMLTGFLISAVLSLPPTLALAVGEGNSTGGGGHPIEAGFKTKTISILKDLGELSPKAKAALKFDPDEVLAVVSANHFRPVCLTNEPLAASPKNEIFKRISKDEILGRLRQESKMARVFDEMPGIVFLNCADYGLNEWSTLFNSDDDQNSVLFIHEGLRVAENIGENAYARSASYITAMRIEREYAKRVTLHLFNTRRPNMDKCRFTFTTKTLRFEVHGTPVASKRTDGYSDREATEAILSDNGWVTYHPGFNPMKITEPLFRTLQILKLARTYQCTEALAAAGE